MVFVFTCALILGLQKLLYGPLRPIEIEQLYEKAWFAVTETCLAMTIFRGEIGAWFLVMFFTLLAGKVWAWIGEGRVEILEQQPPTDPRLFHTRLALSLGLSVAFDLTMLEYVVKEVMHMARPDMMVMFGFEFAVLSIVSLATAARYAINLLEITIVRKQKAKRVDQIRKERAEAAMRQVTDASHAPNGSATTSSHDQGDASHNQSQQETATQAVTAARVAAQQPVDDAEIEVEGWENKGRWVFYLDLATDFFKLVVYLSFFFILLFFYGLPIHILRDVFMTARSFFKRVADFVRYRTATRDMNARYPDATEQEIGREDLCIICREEMRVYIPTANGERANPVAERMRPKKLPCGHVLHLTCLRSWLERQQICPTCRTTVVPATQTGDGHRGAGLGPAANAQPNGGNGANGRGRLARVYRLGPLRIGVGAARGGNVMEELQQQLAGGQARPQAHNQADQANETQQYGFGIRWEGTRRRERSQRGHRTVQEHINLAERQIQREISSLAGSMADVQALRSIESELARIRARRQAVNEAQPAVSTSGMTQVSQTTTLVGQTQGLMTAGSEALPSGLVLPEGWTMMPLQPSLQSMPHVTTQGQGVPSVNVPPNAMFTMPGRPMQFQMPMATMPLQPLQGPFAAPMQSRPQQQPQMTGQSTVPGPNAAYASQQTVNIPSAPTDVPHQDNSTATPNTRISGSQAMTDSLLAASTTQQMQSASEHENALVEQPSSSVQANSSGSASTIQLDSGSSNQDNVPSAINGHTSLPVWGSSVATPTPSGTDHLAAERSDVVDDLTSAQDTVAHPAAGSEMNPTNTTSSKAKHPTVEDLVEEPD